MKSVDEMKEQIVELVPMGTPIAEARKKMEDNGYQCSTVPKNADTPAMLLCRLEKQTTWVTSHTWAVDLSYDESNSVTDVRVRSWETGP